MSDLEKHKVSHRMVHLLFSLWFQKGSVSSITNSLQAKQSNKPSNKNHVLAVTPNLSHSTEPISTAGWSSDICLDNLSFSFPRKLLSNASFKCQPCKNRRMRDCLYLTDAQGEKKQFSTSSEV